jgi:mercuric ion transport protein
MKNATTEMSRGGWRSSIAAAPGILLAFLPKIACPVCWPAYAGVLSAVGLGFLMKPEFLLPSMLVFLTIAVASLAFRAKRRRGFRPALLGLCASALVVYGKFTLDSDALMYGGIALLVAASLWNAWPRKKSSTACPACAPAGNSTLSSEAKTTTHKEEE